MRDFARIPETYLTRKIQLRFGVARLLLQLRRRIAERLIVSLAAGFHASTRVPSRV